MKYCVHCMEALPEGTEQCPSCGKMQEYTAPAHHLQPGTLLGGKYLIGSAIGEGGFGITYIGRDIRLEMRVAVKEYYPNGFANRSTSATVESCIGEAKEQFYQKGKERFLQEARTLAVFSGEPGIVDVRDFFEENQTAYIVMSYLDGETLSRCIRRNGTMRLEDAVTLLLPVMQSLRKIHRKGLVHRDISPDNIILVDGRAKLIDFGAARNVMGSSGKSISVVLKPGYAPVEQYRSKGVQGPWTDVYALSATIYRCITGQIPDDAAERMYQDTLQPPSALGAEISPDAEAALMKGLAVRQDDRYQSVEALLAGLQGNAPVENPQQTFVEEERTVFGLPEQETERTVFQPDAGAQNAAAASEIPVHSPASAQNAAAAPEIPVYSPASAQNAAAAPEIPVYSPASAQNAAAASEIPVYSPASAQNAAAPAQPVQKKKHGKSKKPLLIGGIAAGAVAVGILALAFLVPAREFRIGDKEYSYRDDNIYLYKQTLSAEDFRNISKMKQLNSLVISQCTLEPNALKNLYSLPETLRKLELSQIALTNEDMALLPFDSMENLKTVELYDLPDVTDVSVLAPVFDTLNSLYIANLGVQDYSALTEAVNLTYLSMTDCSGCDFTTLQSGTLRKLQLSRDGITDIGFLQNMPNLDKVVLSDNQIKDISVLQELEFLYDLDLSKNQITDISPLAGLSKMFYLDLSENQIENVTALADMPNLSFLFLQDNAVTSLSPLKDVKKLETLDVRRNRLTDLKGLETAIVLGKFYASNNQLKTLDGLDNSTVLEIVTLQDNQLSSIEQLKKSVGTLKILNISNNDLTDINALSGSVKLEALAADDNQITSLVPLQESVNLTCLSMEHNALTNLDGLENAATLTCIYVPGNQISDASAIQNINSATSTDVAILNLANNSLKELQLNETVRYQDLILYGNAFPDYEMVRTLTGQELQMSYTEDMKIEGLTDGYTYACLVDVPLDQQVRLKENSGKRLWIEFITLEEADARNRERKNAVFGTKDGEPSDDESTEPTSEETESETES